MQQSNIPYTMDIKLRSTLLEEFFTIPRMKLHRLEEAGKITPSYEDIGSRKLTYYDAENIVKIVNYLNKKPEIKNKYSYACWHNKGGVGKSTLVFQIASMMSTLMGLKVLVIDTDGQSDTTFLFNADQEVPLDAEEFVEQRSLCDIVYELMEPENHNEEFIRKAFETTVKHISPGLDLIPADDRLVEIDYDIRTLRNAGMIVEEKDGSSYDLSAIALFKVFLEFVENKYDYDIILIDCSPDLGDLNINVLFAANALLTPVELEPKAPHSLKRVYNRLKRLCDMHESFGFDKMLITPNRNERLDVKAIVQTRIRDMLPNYASKVTLSKTTYLEKGIAHRMTIFSYQDNASKWYVKVPSTAKRLTNELWCLCHEMLDLEIPKMEINGLYKSEES